MIWFDTSLAWPIRSEEIDCQNIKEFIRFLLSAHNSLNKTKARIQSEFYITFSEMRTCKLAISNLTRDPNPGEVTRGREDRLYGWGWITVNTDASLMHVALVSAKEQRWNKVLILSDTDQVGVKALSNGKGPPDWRSLGSFLAPQDLCAYFIKVNFNFFQEQRMLWLIALQDGLISMEVLAIIP
ncbi:hypothetical protein TorRG33x02_137150 [Trema orientale]|uniref:Uncharacterized protein n=1 Tax=Trema orientale TaxID=63057 RepID=A0A2P5EY17_TREOI|nr:hypothetical protein TorRG33x02_137150 [Trema orientale]